MVKYSTTKNEMNNDADENHVEDVLHNNEIDPFYAEKLELLKDYKVAFIFDDSISMRSRLNESPLLSAEQKPTRWDELKMYATNAIRLANLHNRNGTCDVYFLNNPPIKNVLNTERVEEFFKSTTPNGYTPLSRTFKQVLADYSDEIASNGKLLIVIATDGEPTDARGNNDMRAFTRCLQKRPPNVYTNILICSDQDDIVEKFNRLDRKLTNLDVIDDFRSERFESEKLKKSHFTYGDYVTKSLIGCLDAQLDKFDEEKSCTII